MVLLSILHKDLEALKPLVSLLLLFTGEYVLSPFGEKREGVGKLLGTSKVLVYTLYVNLLNILCKFNINDGQARS